MKKIHDVRIISNETIAKDTYQMNLDGAGLPLEDFKPGMFIHIQINEAGLLLRRPISLFLVDEKHRLLSIIYKDLGEGTHRMSLMERGEKLNFLGPLGNGFPLKEDGGAVVLVGGGVGIPPLFELGKRLRENGVQVSTVLGFRDGDSVFCVEDFKSLGPVYVATEDGSMGTKGFVTQIMDQEEIDFETIYACGPKVMLKALDLRYGESKTGYFSFEERMACGTGACYGCMVETTGGLKRVCKDGPVFMLGDVIYE